MSAFKNVLEPGAIVAIFTLGTWYNRRKESYGSEESRSLLHDDEVDEERHETEEHGAGEMCCAKARGMIHSRVLSWFPFLLEIWYWLLIYWVYQGARAVSARVIAGKESVFQTAEDHAIQILSIEHRLHIDIELPIQRLVLTRTPWLIDVLACVYYSHIVVGVAFYVYCYTFLPRNQYRRVRRALALENVIAFTIFSLWRCKPPRLLPEEYGFIDVLHKGNSGSAWTRNRFQLTIATMPSLHFGNAVLIAFALLKFSPHWPLRVVAPVWPMIMGLTVVATANHFVLDAVVGIAVVAVAYRLDRVMLVLVPLERMLFRAIWLEQPRDE